MADLDDVLDRLQEALDEEDLSEICAVARIVLAICGVLEPRIRGARTASGVAIQDPEGDALFDPDELGLEPEEFDVKFWRERAS